jgi:surface antigen
LQGFSSSQTEETNMLTKAGTLFAVTALALMTSAGAASARDHYYYGSECHEQNKTAGTVLGAIAGGIIGNQFGSGGGKAAATIGGVVLGGAIGNSIGSDIDCRDRPHAFRAYNDSFRGPVGHRYDWSGGRGRGRGYITTTREYHRRGMLCRDFQETTYRRGRAFTREGTACRYNDGWHLM